MGFPHEAVPLCGSFEVRFPGTERADIEARAQAEDARRHKRKSEFEKALCRARG
jgi:hypothetical protein